LFPRIGQPHKPSQATSPQSGGVTPMIQPGPTVAMGAAASEVDAALPAQSELGAPAAGPSTRMDSLATATVTNLDATRVQRSNGHVS
jgi:ATP-binding cassette, subfamily C, bacterial PrsD